MSKSFRIRLMRMSLRTILLFAGMLFLGQNSSRAAALTNTWNIDANGLWDTSTNWTPSGAPNSNNTEALFGSKITATRVVTLSASSFTVGNLSFNNANQYTITNVGGAFTSGNSITLSQGTFTDTFDQLGSGSVLINVPLVLSGNTTIWGGTGTGDVTVNGTISGNKGLTKSAGNWTLFLNGANTYTGNNTISSGAVSVAADSALGAVPGGATAASIAVNGGTLKTTASFTLNSKRGITLGVNDGHFDVASGTTLTYNGIVAGNNVADALFKTNSGTLILGGVNTYQGPTTVSGGILSIAADSGLGSLPGSTTPAALTLDGGTLQATAGFALGGNGTRGITLGPGGGTIDVTVSSAVTNLSYLGVIAGPSTSDSLTKSGIGALYLGGVNTYQGITTVTGGILSIQNDSALGAVPASVVANSITLDGGTLNSAVTTNITINSKRGMTLNSGGGTVNVYPGFTVNYGGIIAGAGSLILTNSGMLVLTGANTYAGSTIITNGTLRVSGGAAIPDASAVGLANLSTAILDLNNSSEAIGSLSGGGTNGGNITLGSGTLTVNQTIAANYSGIISGTGGLTKQGTATLTLGATNSYTGPTIINAGTLQAGIANAINSSSSVSLGNVSGAILDLNNFNDAISTLSGGGTNGGNITLGSGTLTVNQSGAGAFSGVISGSGGLTKQGSATLTLGGSNTYTGATTISAGTLQAGAANAFASGSAVSLANTAGAILDLNNFGNTIGNLSGGGATGGNITLGSGTLTVSQSSSGSYDGVISGTGVLVKQGSGTLTLTRASTFNGGVTISAGTLAINVSGALGTNFLTINGSGATLQLGYSDNANNALFNNITMQNGSITRTASANLKSGILDSSHTLTVNGTGTLLDQGNDGTSGYLSVDGPVVVQTGTLTLKALTANDEVRLNQKLTILAGATAKVDGTGAGTVTFGGASGIVIEGQGTAASQSTLDLNSGNSSFNAGTTINLNGAGTGGLKVSGTQAKVDNFLTAGRISTNLTMTGGGTLTVDYTDANLTANFSKAPSAGTQARIGFYVPSGSTNTFGTVANDMQNWGGLVVDGPQNDATAIMALAVNQNLKGDGIHATTLDLLGGDYQLAGGSPVGGKTNTISGTATFSGGIIDGGPGGGSRGLLNVGGDMVIGNTSFGTTGHGLISITMIPGHNTTTTIRPLNTGVNTALNGSLNLLTISAVDSTGTVQVDSHITSIAVSELHVATGTLLLGANNQFNSGAGLVMEGGTLNLNGYNQNFGTLTLTANSHIAFGNSTNTSNTFDFGIPTTMSAMLTIDNWGTNDTLKSDAVLTSTQLGQIRFGTLLAQLDPSDTSGHTIIPVPVPEPSTVAGMILIGGLLVYREKRTFRRVLSSVL